MRRSVSMLMAATLVASAGFAPTYAAMPSPPAFVASSGNAILVDDNDRDPTWYLKGKKNKRDNDDRRYSRDRDDDDDGDRRRHVHSRDRDWDDDDDDAAAAFALGVIGGLATGAIVSSSRPYGGSSWAAACAQRYRSFDPRTGTYMGYDGYRHPCRL